MTPEGGYCYYPMPFAKGAEILLINTTDEPIKGITSMVRVADLKDQPISPLRFHTVENANAMAGRGQLYTPLEATGSGHFVGLTAAMAGSNQNGQPLYSFLEGDEYFWVDREAQASTAGTGTEDYFTCGWYFSAGPITLQTVGAPQVDSENNRVSAYRAHIPDWVPFDESFRFGLEVGNARSSEEYGAYLTVAHYYLER
jgi:hypothetical protein